MTTPTTIIKNRILPILQGLDLPTFEESKDSKYFERVTTMKFKDFINQEVDLDIFDDYTEDLAVNFVGPGYKFTEEGLKKFQPLFDVDIMIDGDETFACLFLAEYDDETCEKLERLAIRYFNWQAGYCKQETFDKYFIDEWR